jgi:hypothetical protein
VNCSQARAMLATYRELNTDEIMALDVHLAECAMCSTDQGQSAQVGTLMRALPEIEPPAEARTKLMQALAVEHMRFLQRTPPATATPPTPVFLAPYLRELAHKAPRTGQLVAISSADTGPLSAITQIKPRRRIQRLSHFSVIGIAAAILLTLMGGSLASLFLLSPHGVPSSTGKASITITSEVQSQSQSVDMTYANVASAVEVNNTIYYTTYNDDQSNWQIERFDEQTKTSVPLLTLPSTQELVILGSSQNWLLWLQIDEPKAQKNSDSGRSWSLRALRLETEIAANSIDATKLDKNTNGAAITLISKQKFNPATVPDWVNKPVQGISFYQNALLVSMLDEKGISHLLHYNLDSANNTPIELDTAKNGHVLTSPTANSDGSSIYWAEEWFDGQQLVSNIWTQQMIDAAPSVGRWVAHKEAHTYLFRHDGQSFHPQIVDDTLFILSTNPAAEGTTGSTPGNDSTTTATQPASSTTTAQGTTLTPLVVDTSNLPGSAIKVNPGVFQPQIDEMQSGKIFTFTTTGVENKLQSFGYDKEASMLQGGSHFLLWLEGQKVRMYDVDAQIPVNVGAAVPENTAFLTVNGDTAVVVLKADQNAQQEKHTIVVNTFNWPWSIKKTTTRS